MEFSERPGISFAFTVYLICSNKSKIYIQVKAAAQHAKRILLPAHIRDNHWVLIHADLDSQVIEVLDSYRPTFEKIKPCDWKLSIHAPLITVCAVMDIYKVKVEVF